MNNLTTTKFIRFVALLAKQLNKQVTNEANDRETRCIFLCLSESLTGAIGQFLEDEETRIKEFAATKAE